MGSISFMQQLEWNIYLVKLVLLFEREKWIEVCYVFVVDIGISSNGFQSIGTG